MVALRGKEIDSYLARPDPGRPIILLYGPDAGLVRERADALMASAVDDPNDPFSLVRLDGDELAAEQAHQGGTRILGDAQIRRLQLVFDQLCQIALGVGIAGDRHGRLGLFAGLAQR